MLDFIYKLRIISLILMESQLSLPAQSLHWQSRFALGCTYNRFNFSAFTPFLLYFVIIMCLYSLITDIIYLAQYFTDTITLRSYLKSEVRHKESSRDRFISLLTAVHDVVCGLEFLFSHGVSLHSWQKKIKPLLIFAGDLFFCFHFT